MDCKRFLILFRFTNQVTLICENFFDTVLKYPSSLNFFRGHRSSNGRPANPGCSRRWRAQFCQAMDIKTAFARVLVASSGRVIQTPSSHPRLRFGKEDRESGGRRRWVWIMKLGTRRTDKGRALCGVLWGLDEGFAKTVRLVRLSRGSSPARIELKYGSNDESLRTICLALFLHPCPFLFTETAPREEPLFASAPSLPRIIEIGYQITAGTPRAASYIVTKSLPCPTMPRNVAEVAFLMNTTRREVG